MSDETRLDLFAALKALSSPPYYKESYWAELVLWHPELTDKLAAARTHSCVASAPKIANTRAECSKPGREVSAVRSHLATRGQPKNDTCDVEVIVYVEVSLALFYTCWL